MLIMLSLGLLLVIVFFNLILGSSFSSYTLNSPYAQTIGIDSLTGALAIIIIIIGIASIIGIQFLGSGMSDESIRTIIIGIAYGSVWGLFSVLSINLIVSIEIFGWLIYATLSILYLIGVIQKITGG